MKSKTFSCSLLTLLILLLAGARIGLAAPPPTNPGQDRLNQMMAEGWKPAANGVLKRNAGPMIETFAMGPEGFSFVYQELRSQLGFLIGEYRRHPSAKLAKTIAAVQEEMARVASDVQAMESAATSQPAAGCDFSYGAHANAYWTSPTQGVQADASAYFNNNCGYMGETYAYAYARATLNGTTRTVTETDPDTGTNISGSATAAVAGTTDCYSYGYARASSVDLGISYSTAQDNYACPPPLEVTISGPLNVYISGYSCTQVTWTSTVSGGTPPYTYSWYQNGYLVGSGWRYTTWFCSDDSTWTETVNLSLKVDDSGGQSKTGYFTTYIHHSGSGGGGCLVSGDVVMPAPIPCLY